MSTQTTPMNAPTRVTESPRKGEAYVLGLLDGWIVVFRGEDYRQPSEDVARGVAAALNSLDLCDQDHLDVEESSYQDGYDQGARHGRREALQDALNAVEELT